MRRKVQVPFRGKVLAKISTTPKHSFISKEHELRWRGRRFSRKFPDVVSTTAHQLMSSPCPHRICTSFWSLHMYLFGHCMFTSFGHCVCISFIIACVPLFVVADVPLLVVVSFGRQIYFLRSMAVLIHAGPGGGVDIPAVKAVLHAQGLERYTTILPTM